MTLLRGVILTALVALGAARLQADPQVILNDPPGPCTSVGLTFAFMSDGMGGGILCLSNASGEDWFSLRINTPAPMPPGPITCGGTAFSTCVVQTFIGGNAIIDFFGGPGIANGANFTVDLGLSGWPPGATFEAFANVPEPATVALLLIGIPALLAGRKRRGESRARIR